MPQESPEEDLADEELADDDAETVAPDPRARQRRWLILLFALVALLIVAPAISIGPYIHHRLTLQSPTPVAAYDGFVVRQDPEFFELVAEPIDMAKSTALFVQLPDDRVFSLVDLPEDEAAKLVPAIPSNAAENDPPSATHEYSDARSFLTYRDGRLVFALLHAQSKKFRIGGNAKGPFATFPLTRAQLVSTLGEPERWQAKPTGPAEPED